MRYWSLLKKEPMRAWYYLQGWIRWYLYKKHILKFLNRSMDCMDCYENGFCKQCGCAVGPLFLSDYKCKKDVGQE